jgi:DNA-binding GntR family transcriptional regulator
MTSEDPSQAPVQVTGNVGATGRLIAAQLRTEILNGSLKPGMRFGQDALAERFNSSRIPVRESLKTLEAEGLVTIVPNAGAWVSRLDAFEFDQIYRLREQVEYLAIRESVGLLTQEQIVKLRSLVQAISESKDVEDFLSLDREFHLLTYAGARFGMLHELVQRFWNTTQHYRRAWAQTRAVEDNWATDAEHRLIVDAIERRDLDSAGNLVAGHIRRTRLALAPRKEIFE